MILKNLAKAMLATTALVSASFAITDIPFYDLPVLDSATNPTATIGPDKNWKVTGTYKIPSGCVLTVQPGTWIFGTSGGTQASRSGVVVVLRGGKLIAEGKADSTIVFTAYGDDKRVPCALGPGAKGLWGGIVILGRAPVSTMRYDSNGVVTKYPYAEGFLQGDNDLYYGGNETQDSSGVLKYVSVRHGGASISSASEVNGVTFYGVGSRTKVDYVEVFANYDDGYEWFGGSVNCKHLISAFNCDDHFDLDDGYVGKCQYLFAIENEYEGARGSEFDGKQKGDLTTSDPKFYNVTLIGSGKRSANNADDQNFGNAYLFCAADSLGGTFNDMIVMDGPVGAAKAWSHKVCGPLPLQNGLEMKSNIFFNFGASDTSWRTLFTTLTSTGTVPVDTNYWFMSGREINNPLYKNGLTDPKLNGISRECFSRMLDPRPRTGSPALIAAYSTTPPNDGFFDATNYIGAFNASNLWTDKWSKLSTAKIQTGLLKITIADEELVWTGGFFTMRAIVKIPNAVVSTYDIKVNGVTVPATVFSSPATLPETKFASWGFRVAGYAVRDLGPACGVTNVNGAPNNNYLVEATVTLNDGTVLKDATTWKITN